MQTILERYEMSDATLSFSKDEMSLLREKNKKLTDIEFGAFLEACKRYQLNPLANQIYARSQPATEKNPRQVTYCCQIDGYRLIADRTLTYAGNEDPRYDDEKNPRRATVTVYKIVAGQRCAFEASARWDQYFPGERQGFMWKKMPHLMLGKCAEALALRKAFPAELSGLYTVEEMHQAGEVEENPFRKEPEQRKPEAVAPAPKPTPAPSPNGKAKPAKPAPKDIKACKTADQLSGQLVIWRGAFPVSSDPAMWKNIVKTCLAFAAAGVSAGTWTDDSCASLNDTLDSIQGAIALVEQGAELLPMKG
jgi:phage recombination protein Bet